MEDDYNANHVELCNDWLCRLQSALSAPTLEDEAS